MKDKSTKTLGEYWFDCLFYLVVSMILYNALLFRCLPDMTYTESKTILWVMIVASVSICSFVLYRKMRTNWTLSISLVVPFGIYTVIAYRQTLAVWMLVILSIAFVSAMAYSVFLLSRRVKKGMSLRKTIKWRIHRCCYIIQSSVSVALILVICSIGMPGVFGDNVIYSTLPATSNHQSAPQTISNNIDTVLLLQEKEWEKLSTQKKLDVLQTVVNIEASYLGLSNELNVGAANLGEDYTLSRYNDRTHTISIDLEHLENNSAHTLLESILHEVRHSYQHRLVDAYHATDEQFKGLWIYKSAKKYEEEFSHYSDGNDDFYSYYHQDCEMDARDYAEKTANAYYKRIAAYLNDVSNDSNT